MLNVFLKNQYGKVLFRNRLGQDIKIVGMDPISDRCFYDEGFHEWLLVANDESEVLLALMIDDLPPPEENEVRTMVDPNSKHDPKLQELTKV